MNHFDLTPIFPYVNEFLVTLLTGVAGVATLWLKSWLDEHKALLGAQLNSRLTQDFSDALDHGVQIAMQNTEEFEKENALVPVQGGLKGWVAARAAQYAVDHSPQYVANFFGADSPDAAMKDAALKALAHIPTPEGVHAVVANSPAPTV